MYTTSKNSGNYTSGLFVIVLVAALGSGACGSDEDLQYRTRGEGSSADAGSGDAGEGNSVQDNREEAQEWAEDQDTIVAPWAHEVKRETAKDATVKPNKLIFPLPEYDHMKDWKDGDVIWANVANPKLAFLRRVEGKTIKPGDKIIFETSEASIGDVYLKVTGGDDSEDDSSGDQTQQGLGETE